jgi:hypothetical protein
MIAEHVAAKHPHSAHGTGPPGFKRGERLQVTRGVKNESAYKVRFTCVVAPRHGASIALSAALMNSELVA